jgi:hypothetical protein
VYVVFCCVPPPRMGVDTELWLHRSGRAVGRQRGAQRGFPSGEAAAQVHATGDKLVERERVVHGRMTRLLLPTIAPIYDPRPKGRSTLHNETGWTRVVLKA